MQQATDTTQPVVTDELRASAQEVIQTVHRNTRHAFLLDAKLGDGSTAPMRDTQIAQTYDTPRASIKDKMSRIIDTLVKADRNHGNPLHQISLLANDAMAASAIINRHVRRPPLYSEGTITTFINMGLATPEHSPLIRASGYVLPPTVVLATNDADFMIADVATHMARSNGRQTPEQIIEALQHRRANLELWPQLDMTLFIERLAGIRPDCEGRYDPNQPWGKLVSPQRLVASTMIRVLERDRQPRTTAYLDEEIRNLVGYLLPHGYNTINAIRNAAYPSDEISWQGTSTFGLTEPNATTDHQKSGRRGRTGDRIHAFLMEHGPANVEDIIEHIQQNSNAKRRTVQDAVNHDLKDRFIRLSDRRIAANPILEGHDRTPRSPMVVPDENKNEPRPVLRESELAWLTRYIQALNDLTPPLPLRVAVTGPRATGLALEEPLVITVVLDADHRPSLEPRLAQIADAVSERVQAARPKVMIMSLEEWDQEHADGNPDQHHNIWMAPDEAPAASLLPN
ncbi:MAG: hypothetical protein OXF79_16710 [Chloroflexi bacterium]|nr:hypothetical protein [Chloroflexota bacterium]